MDITGFPVMQSTSKPKSGYPKSKSLLLEQIALYSPLGPEERTFGIVQ